MNKKKFFALIILALIAGCGKKDNQNENAKLSISIPAFTNTSDHSVKELSLLSANPSLPTSLDDFHCFFINVMGEGIETASTYTDYNSISEQVSSSGIVALSSVSTLINPADGGTLSLNVNIGINRIVSLLGVMMNDASPTDNCPVSFTREELNSRSGFPFVTEIARSEVNITGDTNIILQVPTTGIESKTESRLNVGYTATTFTSSSPETSNFFAFPSTIALTYGQNMATPPISSFTIVNNTCTTAPTVSSVSVSDAVVTVNLSAGTCTNGQSFDFQWSALKNISGVADTTTRSITLTKDVYKIFVTDAAYNIGTLGGGSTTTAISQADSACNSDANKPAGEDSYKALIGSSLRQPGTDWVFAANTEYYATDETTLVFTTAADGTFGSITNPLDDPSDGSPSFVTGLTNSFEVGNNCTNWTTDDNGVEYNSGYAGSSSVGNFLNFGTSTCDQSGSLLCVQQN